jgi:RND family efflux transporter MFP subunit
VVGKLAIGAAGEANVRRLKQLQYFEKVTAPFDGVITARNTDIGALITAGSAKELFHLTSTQQLRVFTPVPEVDAAAVRNGERVTLTQDAYPGQIFSGTIVRNANAIDQTTRTLNVEVDVDNPTGRLLPGAYIFVHFRAPAASHSVTIPSNTLLFRSEGLRVGVVRNGHIQLVPVTIGHDFGNAVEVLSGLRVKDAVVVDPSDSLTDGALVHTL